MTNAATTTADTFIPAFSEEELAGMYEAYVESEIEDADDLIRAERANEYAIEGVANYEEGSYLEQAREDARFWTQASYMMERHPRF